MRVILVPVANRPECARALETSFDLARRLSADLVGCHIRPHRVSARRIPVTAGLSPAWLAASQGRNPERLSRDARELFTRIAEREAYPVATRPRADGRPVAIWYERVGSPDRIMPIVGPLSDLVVVSRPAARGGRLARLFLMEALLHSTRPVLVLPQRRLRAPGRRVVIAWNGSPEASRAVAAGMPLIEAADAVTIVAAGPEGGPGPKAARLRRYLAHHGVRADLVKTRGRDPAAEIERACEAAGADLLLMGAYSRHRLRERIFGGLTDHALRRSRLPVLASHA